MDSTSEVPEEQAAANGQAPATLCALPANRKLFVYGTLKPGHLRWPLLAPFTQGGAVPATVTGTLIDPGFGWPALIPEEGRVTGFLVVLQEETLSRAWRALDQVEGADLADPLFHRAVLEVTTRDTNEHTRATCYIFAGDSDGIPRIDGTW